MPYKRNTTAQLYFLARDNVTGAPTAGLAVSASRILSANSSASAVEGAVTSVGGGRWRFSASATDMNADHVAFFFVATSMVPVCLNIRTQSSGELLTAADISAAVDTALDNLNLQNLSANMETRFANVSAAVAGVSAALSARAAQALTDYDPPTKGEMDTLSANLHTNIGSVSAALLTSAGISAQVATVLTNAQIATSAGTSAVVVGAIQGLQVPSSAAVSAIVEAIAGGGVGLTSAQASTIFAGALANYDPPTKGEIDTLSANLHTNIGSVSAAISARVAQALGDADIATSADVSAIVANLGGVGSAQASAIMAGALTNFGLPTSANMETRFANISGAVAAVSALILTSAEQSAIAGGAATNALTAYDVPTSADVSAIMANAGGVTSAQVSTIVQGIVPAALTNFYSNVETGAAVSATASGIQLRASAASAGTHLNNFVFIYDASGSSETEKYSNGKGQMRFITAYATATKWAGVNKDWDITPQGASYILIPAQALSADVMGSAETSAVVQAALTNFGVATSAVVSAAAKQAISDASLATSANLSATKQAVYNLSASMSAMIAGVLTNSQIATSAVVAAVSAAISTHVAQALTDYDALTSSDMPIKANLVQVAGSSADAQTLANSLAVVIETSASGTPTTTVIPTELTAAQMPDNDWLVGRIVTFRGGALDGQQVEITGATSAGNLTVTTCTRAPLDGQAMIIT